MNVPISIVIATYERSGLLKRSLESLLTMTDVSSLEKVVVIENGSDEAGELCNSLLEQLPIQYFHLPEPGKGRALQWYLDQVEDGFLLFLDDDIRVSTEILKQYEEAIEKHGPGHYFGGELRIDYEEEPFDWLIRYLPPSAKGWDSSYIPRVMSGTKFFAGANFGAFVQDLKSVGGFRGYFGPGALHPGNNGNPTGSEWDIQRRMYESGMSPVVVKDAPVWHFVPKTNCSPDWTLQRIFRNGYTNGILRREAADRGSESNLYVVKLSVFYIKARLLAWLGGLVRDPKSRFLLQRRFYHIKGQFKGYGYAGRKKRNHKV